MEWMQFAIEYAKDNQFLVGGVGTVLFGAIMYFVRSVPSTIYLWIKRTCTSEFTITTRNDHYEDFLRVLYNSRVTFFSRNYAIAETTTKLVPGYGVSFGWFAKRPVLFQKSMIENKNHIEEKVEVTFFTRKLSIIQQFIAQADSNTDEDTIRVYFSDGNYWSGSTTKKKRSLSTVFVDAKIKDHLVSRVKWFVDNEKWYNDRGIPYKFCVLLHGPPGTGKTSLIHALASEFDSNVRFIKDLIKVDSLFESCSSKDLIVIEDIDTLSKLSRDKSGPPQGKKIDPSSVSPFKTVDTTLHTLLNSIDGFQTSHGSIIVITTNHLEDLDPALCRVGRVDELIEVGPLPEADMISMFKSFYPNEDLTSLHNYLKTHTYKPRVGAELQAIFANNLAEEAIRLLSGPHEQKELSNVA